MKKEKLLNEFLKVNANIFGKISMYKCILKFPLASFIVTLTKYTFCVTNRVYLQISSVL